MRSTLVACLAGAVLGTSVAAFAHHSTANFDMDVTDSKGSVHHYKIFTVAKVVMTRNGWTIGDLKAGDHVTVLGNPDRKQPDYLYLQKITFASGKEWDRQRVF
jgi:hypothetical protein